MALQDKQDKVGRSKAASASEPAGFSEAERAAMRERARESRPGSKGVHGESAVLAKISELPEAEQALARRLFDIVKATAPSLSPRTWYGMPAWADERGRVVCFFQSAHKFNSRYATFGFTDAANLDEGAMWPVAFALRELSDTEEARIVALVKKAVS